MRHSSDCAVHNEPAEGRERCNCGVVNQIQQAINATVLAQSLVKSGPADTLMTDATIALSAAKQKLLEARGKADA